MRQRISHFRKTLLVNRPAVLVLLVLALPLWLGAWKEMTGRSINPRYVERIEDGKTKKHQILVLFGDPQEINRTPEGLVFIYKSYKAAEAPPSREIYKIPEPQSTSPYGIEEQLKQEKKPKKSTKVLSSTLTIRFKPDGETVQSHEYKEF